MSFIEYIEEKISFVLYNIGLCLFVTIYLKMMDISFLLICIFVPIWMFLLLAYLFISYKIEKKKTLEIMNLIEQLKEKYLIAEILHKPRDMKSQAYYYALKKACKAMNDAIGEIEYARKEYREYMESFVHEIKTPISAISLLCENNQDNKLKKEVRKIDNLVEQFLFYGRSGNAEKDYFIKNISMEELLHNSIMNFKEVFLKENIALQVEEVTTMVYTDEKWLTFVLNQIIGNAIKYFDKEEKNISIHSTENKEHVKLVIEDNGIGIGSHDLPRIFEYGFTGSDRKKEHSTGMGLYICKRLCDSLGLRIEVTSKEKEGTTVSILFPKGKLYREESYKSENESI